MSESVDDPAAMAEAPRRGRTPMCSRCRNHGLRVPVRGHAGRCEWKECRCRKCALISRRRSVLAAHRVLCRPGHPPTTPEESIEAAWSSGGETGTSVQSPPVAAHVPAVSSLESMASLDYYEQEARRMSLGCPPMYLYPGIPRGFSLPPFRGLPSPPPFPIRGMRPQFPLQDRGEAAHFQGQCYYTPMYSFMPAVDYMPARVPRSVSMVAETSRNFSGSSSTEDQSYRTVSERSETPNKDLF